MATITDRVVIARPICGICHMQVCAVADATDEEILEICNSENPSGTAGGWSTVIRSNDQADVEVWGNLEPVACEDHNDRKHFMVSC